MGGGCSWQAELNSSSDRFSGGALGGILGGAAIGFVLPWDWQGGRFSLAIVVTRRASVAVAF